MHGKFVFFHENGQIEMEGEYLNGAEHGRWDFYNTLGRWIQGGNYNKGRIITRITEDPIGIKKPDSSNRTTSFANGQIKSTSPKKNGKPHGDWIGYYENGQIRRITHFEDGKAQGKVELFYEDGSLKKFDTRLNGKRVGETKSFYKSGQLDYQGQYDSYSEKDGTWLYYSDSGDLARQIDYLRGKLINVVVF